MEEKVIKIISDAIKVDSSQISLASNFREDLNLDSLDIVELVMKMEDEFKIDISEEESEKLKTVQDVVNYINKVKQ